MLTNFCLNYMPKKISVQDAIIVLLKKTEREFCKFLPNKVEETNLIKDSVAIFAVMSGIIFSIL